MYKAIRGAPEVTPIEFNADYDILTSDHKPVHGVFDITCWFQEAAEDMSGRKIADCQFTNLVLVDIENEKVDLDSRLTAKIYCECFKEEVSQVGDSCD